MMSLPGTTGFTEALPTSKKAATSVAVLTAFAMTNLAINTADAMGVVCCLVGARTTKAFEDSKQAVEDHADATLGAVLNDLKVFNRVIKNAGCEVTSVSMCLALAPSITVEVTRGEKVDYEALTGASKKGAGHSAAVRTAIKGVIAAGSIDGLLMRHSLSQQSVSVTISSCVLASSIGMNLVILEDGEKSGPVEVSAPEKT